MERIDGEIVDMSPIGSRHMRCVAYLNDVLVRRRLEGRAVVSPQNSLRLSRHTEPQPGVVVLRPPLDRYARDAPKPEDALLVVDIGDTPLAHDRQVKLPCYAAAGLSEVWIADLVADLVGTYRVPAATVDTETRRLVRAQHAAPAAFPDVVLSVADIVG